MNSVVLCLSSFVFGLHLVMNPWRLGDIVRVSFCFICVCVCVCVCVCGRFVYNFQRAFFLNPEEYELRRGGGNKKGRNFSILKTRGDPTIRDLLWGLWDGWYQSHQIWVLQSPRVSRLGKSHFGKLGVHQIRRRLVQFLSRFPPCFLKGLRKQSFVFFSRKVTLKFICVGFTDAICVIHGQP